MKKAAFTILILAGIAGSVFAQTELFKVLVNKGKNTVDNKPIFAGSKIFEGQTILVTEGGYLAMIYKNGKSMELKTPGPHKVMELEKQAIATSGTFSKKYAELVMSEVTKSSSNLTDNRKGNMKVTGSVERGDKDKIVILSPKSSDLLASQIKVQWLKDSASKGGYVIKLKDLFDEPLKSFETVDTFITFKIGELGLKQTKSFIFTVEPKVKAKGDKAPDAGKLIKIVDGKRAEDLQREIKNVKEEAGGESALSNIILAAFCEQHKLYLEAVNYYEQAIALEPSVEEYKYAFENFLIRNEVFGKNADVK